MPHRQPDKTAIIQEAHRLWNDFIRGVKYDGLRDVQYPLQILPAMEHASGIVPHRRDTAIDRHVQRGWFQEPALDGYYAWLRAFQAVHELSDIQLAKLNTAATIIDELRNQRFTPKASDQDVEAFVEQKLKQLNDNGVIYLVGGSRHHFNIVRIRQLENGDYTRTLYDAGFEARVVGTERDDTGQSRTVVNAIEERRIKPHTEISDLLNCEMKKLLEEENTGTYNTARCYLENVTEPLHSSRPVKDFAQRKNNCTTRSQRTLINHVLQDTALSNELYKFITNGNLLTIHFELGHLLPRTATKPTQVNYTWKTNHPSAAYGPSAQYGRPFPSEQADEVTDEMAQFAAWMSTQGVTVVWGAKERDGKCYNFAYVPLTDTKSVNNLVTYISKFHQLLNANL